MANTSNSTTLTTDFNVTPYYDDYDYKNYFYRLLFKPGYAVQARELTQIQTTLQKQIDRFGKHVFREGSIVLPGQFAIEQDIDYVRIKDVDNSNNTISVSRFKNREVRGLTNNVAAYVIDVADGVETANNTKTLFVRYLSSSNANTAITTFTPGEVLTSNVGNIVVTSDGKPAANTGKGSRFVISEGVFFAKEHFIAFDTQSVILNRYSPNANARVGFFISEEIVNFEDDTSLLDPALESSNYAAPGADRLRLTPTLATLELDDQTAAPDFVELFTIKEGVVTELYERSQYNILRDELAKRTLDESGDYYVRGLGVRVRENLDTGVNGGLSNTGNSQLLSVGVEPGLAYVKGYEVSKLVTDYITTEKSTTYANVATQAATATMGNYIRANEFMGTVEHDKGTIVFLKDVASRKLSTGNNVSTTALGNTIGTARVKSIEYHSGLLGTPTGNVNIYLYDIRMNGTNSFANTRSFSATNFISDVVLESGNTAVLKDTATDTLLYYVGSDAVRNVRDISGNPSVSFNFKRTSDVTLIAAGNPIDLPISITGESFPYGTATLGDSDKRDIILAVKNTSFNIAGPGTVSNTGTNALTGTSTEFTKFNVGDKIEFGGNSKTYFVNTITNNTSMTVTETLPNLSGAAYFKAYKAGDIIDLTSKGFGTGLPRTVSATSNTLSFNLQETLPTDVTGTVTYQVFKTDGREVAKTLVPNVFVRINVAAAGTTTGPYSLGFSDVYQIRSIRKASAQFTTETAGSDVTSQFIFDNGQRDNLYDYARITPKSPLSASDHLLVKLDYFVPSFTSGQGYYSVDSYPINDSTVSNTTIRTENIPIYTSPVTGQSYNLRNYLDFRSIKANTAVGATTVTASSINPSSSGGFVFEANGLRLPAPSTQFTYDYSYFFGRTDLIVIDKDGNLSAIRGVPSSIPRTPTAPENTMALAAVQIAPYPSLSPNYAQILNRRDLSCVVRKLSNIRYTMRDIGVLKNRIMNLEYYASLSLLEKAALDLKILDENGLDRFKNGLFVDTFRDHTLGEVNNPDYKIVVDRDEQSIRPIYTMHSFYYDYLSGSNVVKTGDLVTLPYANTVFLDQPVATSFRNIELSSYRFIGNLYMNPEIDVWADTDYLEDFAITIGPDANSLPQGTTTEWNDWQKKITGYQVEKVNGLLSGGGLATLSHAYVNGGAFTNISGQTLITNPNSPRDQKVTEYTSLTRDGLQTTYSVQENAEKLGSRVVDVSLVPYIRPQTIIVNARGMKALTRLFVFFDGEDMNQYVTPLTAAEYALGEGMKFRLTTNAEGSQLVSGSDGEAYFLLRLPQEKRFRVGQKEVVVTDSPTNAIDASTFAKDYFVAQGLIQQKQDTILTTRQSVKEVTPVSESRVQTRVLYIDNPSCSAYSFLVKAPEGEEGLFMTKVDLYMAAKHPTLGIWVEIREMDSAGGITRNQVPFSEVWIPSSEITISSDGLTNPHVITFPAPVFLYNNTQYAFVIHTVGLNPDTYFWISRLGETNRRTGNIHNARPLTGTFYTTNNNLNWDMVPDIDLRCTLYRASFQTGVVGEAILGNKPVEKLRLANTSADLRTYGEGFIGNYRLGLSGNTGSIALGDRVVGQTSGANSVILAVNGTTYTVANTSYLPNENVTIRDPATLAINANSTITSITFASGVLSTYKVYEGNTTAEMISSNGNFFTGDVIRGSISSANAEVTAIQNYRYSLVDFEPTYLKFNKTSIQFFMQPTSNTGTPGSYIPINDGENYYFDTEQAIFSRSNEVATLSGAQSNKVKINMSTTSDFQSPVFDVGRAHSVYVDNIINVLGTGDLSEANTSGGNLINKYISQPVVLAEGQDAEDINVVLTAYRPPNTDVRVWVKILNGEDSDTLAQARWYELEKLTNRTFSSLSNRNDFKEYTYKFPDSMLTGPPTDSSPGGEVQYTNSQGITFTGFKFFQIKIGLEGSNSAVVPRCADLRAICLQL